LFRQRSSSSHCQMRSCLRLNHKPSMPTPFLVSPSRRHRRHASPLKENQVSQRFQHSVYLRSSTFYRLIRCWPDWRPISLVMSPT
jgi:hypothetical protein